MTTRSSTPHPRTPRVAAADRSVRVRTEVAALSKAFDYAVPDSWSDDVRVGTRVRVPLHGRSVRGWVVADDATAPDGVDVLPLKSWLGWGPPPERRRTGGVGLVALGRPAVVLLAGRVAGHRRPCAAGRTPLPAADRSPAGPSPAPPGALRPAVGAGMGRGRGRRGARPWCGCRRQPT